MNELTQTQRDTLSTIFKYPSRVYLELKKISVNERCELHAYLCRQHPGDVNALNVALDIATFNNDEVLKLKASFHLAQLEVKRAQKLKTKKQWSAINDAKAQYHRVMSIAAGLPDETLNHELEQIRAQAYSDLCLLRKGNLDAIHLDFNIGSSIPKKSKFKKKARAKLKAKIKGSSSNKQDNPSLDVTSIKDLRYAQDRPKMRDYQEILKHQQRFFEAHHPQDEANKHEVLLPHQVYGLRFLISHFNAGTNPILADSMGLGKTIQALATIQAVRQAQKQDKKPHQPVLIVCPSSCISNWKQEALRWLPKDMHDIKTYIGPPRSRNRIRIKPNTILIGSYETLSSEVATTKKFHRQFDMAFFDEGHRLKNNKTKTYKNFLKLDVKHKCALTGTPFQNNTNELIRLLSFLNPSIDFQTNGLIDQDEIRLSISECRRKLYYARNPINNTDFLDSLKHGQVFKKIIGIKNLSKAFILRRTQADPHIRADLAKRNGAAFQLPASPQCTHLTFTMNEKQKDLYEQVRACWNFNPNGTLDVNDDNSISVARIFYDNKRKTKTSKYQGDLTFMAAFQLLRQIVNVPGSKSVVDKYCQKFVLEESVESLVSSSGKLETITQLIRQKHQQGKSILVGVSFHAMAESISYLCEQLQIESFVITGKCSQRERKEAIESFNRSGPSVMIVAYRAAGEGLNLQKASVVIQTDDELNPSVLSQFLGRSQRLGQSQQVEHFVLKSDVGLEVETFVENHRVTKEQIVAAFYEDSISDFMRRLIQGLIKETNSVLTSQAEAQMLTVLETMITEACTDEVGVRMQPPSAAPPEDINVTAQSANAAQPEDMNDTAQSANAAQPEDINVTAQSANAAQPEDMNVRARKSSAAVPAVPSLDELLAPDVQPESLDQTQHDVIEPTTYVSGNKPLMDLFGWPVEDVFLSQTTVGANSPPPWLEGFAHLDEPLATHSLANGNLEPNAFDQQGRAINPTLALPSLHQLAGGHFEPTHVSTKGTDDLLNELSTQDPLTFSDLSGSRQADEGRFSRQRLDSPGFESKLDEENGADFWPLRLGY